MNHQTLLNQYDYKLPKERIAKTAAMPRDTARLLIYNKRTKHSQADIFKNLAAYLPKGSLLVVNQTRVIPARLIATKPTGGRVELLYVSHDKHELKMLANKALARGSVIYLRNGNKTTKYSLTVIKKVEGFYFFRPSFSPSQTSKIIQLYGITPLPPYMKDSPLSEKERRKNYQTIFAKTGQSIAAPTASLHFTKRLFTKLKKQGIDVAYIQLDVGLGTFAPLTQANTLSGKLHEEFFHVDKAAAKKINAAKKSGRAIIAVGTTVVRTLESVAKQGRVSQKSGQTNLFIRPGYNFQIIDGLITNFHVPKSSLLMLVAALVGRKKLLSLYSHAIKKRFRFFSFGDGMLIL